MARHPDFDPTQREPIRDRVKFLLEYHWDSNQRQMARDLGVTQGLISKIINGHQGAGKRFLTTLGRQPGINAEWVARGQGQPLSLPPQGTLPIASTVLPGSPLDHPHLHSGHRHPVAQALDRPTRYWLEVSSYAALLRDANLRLMMNDLALIETDTAWTSRIDLVAGRLCGVRVSGGSVPIYTFSRLVRDSSGHILAPSFSAEASRFPEVSSPAASDQSQTPKTAEPTIRRRRKIRSLDQEAKKAAERAQQDDVTRHQEKDPDNRLSGQISIDLQDIVGVCVYLVRPFPSAILE